MKILPRLLLLLALPSIAAAGQLHPVAAPGTGPMTGIASMVSAAFGPDGGVAVWRMGFAEIWGAPLDRDGIPTGPARRILEEVNGADTPQVRYFRGEFLLWWIRGTPRVSRIATLSPDLVPSEPRTLAVSAPAPDAWNGDVSVVFTTAGTIQFLDRSFARLRAEPLDPATGSGVVGAVSLLDGSFAVVTAGANGMFVQRFSPSGEPLFASKIAEAGGGAGFWVPRTQVATDGESLLVLWASGTESAVLESILVRGNGTVARHTLSANQWKSMVRMELEWADGSYTVVVSAGTYAGQATDTLDLYAARVGPDGAKTEGFVPIAVRNGLETKLAMARSGSRHVVLFHQDDLGMDEILAVSLPTTGSLVRPQPALADGLVSSAATPQAAASAASDGTGWLAAWVEYAANREEIRAVLLGPDGAPAAPPLTLGAVYRWIGLPVVAFNGVDYVVAWINGSGLVMRRVRTDGTAVDPDPVWIAPGGGTERPVMAPRDGIALVAQTVNSGIRGLLIHANGGASPPFAISPLPHEEGRGEWVSYERPVVAAGSDGFLVAWVERRTAFCVQPRCDSTTRAQAQLVTREGAPRGPLMRLDERAPRSAASAGGTYLLTFDSGHAVVIDAASAIASAVFPLTAGPATVFSSGGEYVVPWRLIAGDALLVKRLAPDGSFRAQHETEAPGSPAAIGAAGTILSLTSQKPSGAPYFGATGVFAHVADTFVPRGRDRGRTVSR
ncbi:MAG TPA: hypothetical protein VGF40_01295 [Thermoanaerobaculia bacterium]